MKAEWHTSQGRQLQVRWKGHNFLGDTWEYEEHVEPSSKVKKFDDGLPLTIDLRWAVGKLRSALLARMTSRKITERGAVHRAPLPIPALECPAIARALVTWACELRRPKLQPQETPSGELRIEIWELDHLADVVALQVHTKDVGIGNLRIKCGAASHSDMMMLVPPLVMVAGASGGLTLHVSAATFNGKTGLPRFAKILDEDEQHTTEEQGTMVEHAKTILKQTWVTYPIEHWLKQRGWQNLPRGVHALPTAVGMPGFVA